MTPLSLRGTLTKRDISRLINEDKQQTIGPIAVYYAGITAPAVSAAFGLLGQVTFERISLSNYWVTLLSAILAALAGISWYLIIMRWSRRDTTGRTDEVELETELMANETSLLVKRGLVETRIPWEAITRVRANEHGLKIKVSGGPTILVPERWADPEPNYQAFHDFVVQKGGKIG